MSDSPRITRNEDQQTGQHVPLTRVPEQTFIFADLAGFTALTEAHGDETAAEIAGQFCDAVRQILPEHHGEELNLIGDAVLLRVPKADDAARLALRIVGEHHRHEGLQVRIGMHTGTAVHRGSDWFGAAINVAARIADVAAAGEVLLSGMTHAHLHSPVRTTPRGQRSFKNVAQPITLHELITHIGPAPHVLRIDPVCRMAIDPALAAVSRKHDGIEHHFCSASCHTTFDRFPERYAPPRGPEPDPPGSCPPPDAPA